MKPQRGSGYYKQCNRCKQRKFSKEAYNNHMHLKTTPLKGVCFGMISAMIQSIVIQCLREREKQKEKKATDKPVHLNGHHRDLYMLCLTSCFIVFLLPIFSLGLSIPQLLHFSAWTPTEWKTAGLGTAQSTLCPILQ